MFKKILIANRGEIAIRIARTCRDLGVKTVGIYSDSDREAPFLDWMDEAYALRGRSSSETYTNIQKIIEIAKRSSCDAIHPGYGFLSENADFALACQEAGITFIGPSHEAIFKMGDKLRARSLAAEAGVPILPGYGPLEKLSEAESFVTEHGLPVVIKAAGGGGGKGLRTVNALSELATAIETAQREGLSYFGSSDVYIEKYLPHPRHVEVQIFGRCDGDVFAIGTRDCSTQRRRQKLIEEAPAPLIDDSTRAAMELAAVNLAKAVGYKSAGTVEMLLSPSGDFYFLEMNTRLQVEHTVTEVVYGCDLVAMQILTAAGYLVDVPSSPLGHAIQCRINAEDVANDFMPVSGRIGRLREPAGPWVRVDSGIASGCELASDYDSLLAKLIVWGKDRREAIARLRRALMEYVIEGVPSTLDFHRWMVNRKEFIEGPVSTHFVQDHMGEIRLVGATLSAPSIGSHSYNEENLIVEVDGRRFEVIVYSSGENKSQKTNTSSSKVRAATSAGLTRRTGEDTLVSPIQGNLLRVLVSEGEMVSAGQPVCIIESMKMENEIAAHKNGKVSKLLIEPGNPVVVGQPLMEISS